MKPPVSDIAFTPAVKAQQTRRGSRPRYAQLEHGRGWNSTMNEDLAATAAQTRSFYLGTASADGQPYIQHRGGPAGFLTALDAQTLAFADYAGNQQYVTLGNLSENPRAFLFLMDYARRRRVKLWGRARVVEDDPALFAALQPISGPAPVDRAILFTIEAWDRNCAQHIPRLLPAEEVEATLAGLQARIRTLETALAEAQG